MVKFWIGVVGLVGLSSGCVPSKEVRSAGQVGCSPDEIAISSDDYHFGLLQSGESWVAQCRGRAFICTQMNEVHDNNKGLGTFLGSEQISCKEMAETPEAERKRLVQQSAGAMPPTPRPAAPLGAAGFAFGESAQEAQRRCEAAGNEWDGSASEAVCSGGAVDVGSTAQVALRFCEGRTCSVTIEHRPQTNWSSSAVGLKAKLEAKYGSLHDSQSSIPESCRSEAEFVECLETGLLQLRYRWQWPSGESLEMTVGKAEAAASSIRVVYARSSGSLSASAL